MGGPTSWLRVTKPVVSRLPRRGSVEDSRHDGSIIPPAARQGLLPLDPGAASAGDMLHVGQKLVLPADATGVPAPASTSSGSGASVRAGSGTYTVVPGDTLGAIARRHGVKVGDIALLNNITDPAKLRVGQVLKLPAGAASVSTPAAPARSVAPATTTRPAAPAPVVAPPRQPEPAVVTPAPVESFPATSQDPSAITPVEPVEPVAPVDPVAVPVIRIE